MFVYMNDAITSKEKSRRAGYHFVSRSVKELQNIMVITVITQARQSALL
jgi:hypothetical protein